SAATPFVRLLPGLLAGPTTPIRDLPARTPYLGLDFFILDLFGSTLVFVFIEKIWPLRREQPVFREEWQGDLTHFFFNHLVVGFVLLITNRVVHGAFGWAASPGLQSSVSALPFLAQVALII